MVRVRVIRVRVIRVRVRVMVIRVRVCPVFAPKLAETHAFLDARLVGSG